MCVSFVGLHEIVVSILSVSFRWAGGGGVWCDWSRAWELVEEVLCGVIFEVGPAVVRVWLC